MRRALARCFGYERTLAAKLHGPKSRVMVLHPALQSRPWREHVDDAVEALGLARAVKQPEARRLQKLAAMLFLWIPCLVHGPWHAAASRWDILPGPSEPRNGWHRDARVSADAPPLPAPEGLHWDPV